MIRYEALLFLHRCTEHISAIMSKYISLAVEVSPGVMEDLETLEKRRENRVCLECVTGRLVSDMRARLREA